MSRSPTILFWIEVFLAVCSAIATVLSLVWPQWIEAVFEESPDAGDGSAERLVAVVFLVATVVFSWFARREWQQRGTKSGFDARP
jgi:hypothetical protein